MTKLILMRHGQSEWNKRKIFTGWIDIPLSQEGIAEAIAGGKEMENERIDLIYTSTLIRCTMTVMLAMTQNKHGKIPCIQHDDSPKWRICHDEKTAEMLLPVKCASELNERMYGKLQGLNKEGVRSQFGEDLFNTWRRSYSTPPPEGESLQMTAERVLPYFQKEIVPQLNLGKNILIVAHGNSLRAIVMHLDQISEENISKLEIPLAKPLIYEI